ncbi:MAG: PadR family transcriptional regulator, partial [Promethearchaeota archaeon]
MSLLTNNQTPTDENKLKGLGKGYIRWIVLALLDKKAHSGYELKQAIADTLEGWRPSPGTLYPLLHELQREKLITGQSDEKEGRRRINYKIEQKGKTQLEAAATQHFLFVSGMRKILGKYGSSHLRMLPSFQVSHVLPIIHKRVKMILDEVHLLPKEVLSNPDEASKQLRSRLQYLEEHAALLQAAIDRVQKQLNKIEERSSRTPSIPKEVGQN